MFVTFVAVAFVFLTIVVCSGVVGTSSGTRELLDQNTKLTWQLKAKQDELDEMKQDVRDGLLPCNGLKEKP
jgi:hypothetical protein